MALTFEMDDCFSDDDVAAIAEEANSILGDQVRVETPDDEGLGFDVAAVTPIIGLVVGVIMLSFRLRDEVKAMHERNQWDGPRLREVIDTEMLRLGLPIYEVIEVKNFAELQRNSGNPCSVIARSKDEEQLVRVFRNGDSYSIRQSNDS